MKQLENQYLWEKVNNKFDRDLDTLRDSYTREAEMLMMGDAQDLTMTRKRNRLWMWFDRKTQFKLLPKILIVTLLLLAVIEGLAVILMAYWKMDVIASIDIGVVFLLLFLLIPALALCLAGVSANTSGGLCQNNESDTWDDCSTITSPAFRNLDGNIWHKAEDD